MVLSNAVASFGFYAMLPSVSHYEFMRLEQNEQSDGREAKKTTVPNAIW